ncbi:MAG: nuclear transport factor 2 family protein [Propionibacteriaceae bacterium]
MANDHVDLVRRGYEAANRADVEGSLTHVSPDIEWRWAGAPLHGVAEVREMLEGAIQVLRSSLEVKELVAVGQHQVLAVVHQYSSWRETAVRGQAEPGIWTRRLDLWTFSDGLAVRYEQYFATEGLLEFAKRDRAAAEDPARRERWFHNLFRRSI